MIEEPVSRVARKRRVARQRLIEAASAVIAERGVEGLRLRELADRADVGFGSFYTHFESKEELVEAVVVELLGVLTAAIIERAAVDDDPARVAADAHRQFVRLAYDDPPRARLIVQLDHADALLETAARPILAPLLQDGLASGRFTGVDVEVAVSFIVGATIAVMRGILDGRLGPRAEVSSARALLRVCGLSDAEAAELAAA
jgi:AcrR family transcriptional regulator